MIIDCVGMRGAGKSTFCQMVSKHRGFLTRENRKQFEIPIWHEFKEIYPELADYFMREAQLFTHYETDAKLRHRTIRRKKSDFCFYAALKKQLGKRSMIWDKGLLECIIYLQLHGKNEIDIDAFLKVWPRDIKIILIESKDAFKRASARPRNEHWSKKVYSRMQERHNNLIKWLPHTIVKNNRSIESLRRQCLDLNIFS